MGLRINNNIAAFNAYRNLSVTDGQMSKSLEKLSSGFRINRAADDASGLAISEGLRAQIGGLKVAVRNAQDGISVVQTAEGALTETHSILQRMRDLAVQASNDGAQSTESKAAANAEFAQLVTELDDIASKTTFNGTNLLDGSYSGTFQVGAQAGETLSVSVTTAMSSTGLSVNSLDLTTAASAAITAVNTAINTVEHHPGRPRCLAEPAGAQDHQPQRGGGEPDRLGEPDPRHRHGPGNGVLHQVADPVPGGHGHVGPGQPGPAVGPAAAAVSPPAGVADHGPPPLRPARPPDAPPLRRRASRRASPPAPSAGHRPGAPLRAR